MSELSEEYEFYSSSAGEEEELVGYSDESDVEVDDASLDVASTRKRAYRILEAGELAGERADAIKHVMSILGTESELTVRMLRLYKWCPSRTIESWFEDSNSLKERVGYCEASTSGGSSTSYGNQTKCLACFEVFYPKDIAFLPCGHGMCYECWSGFITASVESGPACLSQRCPVPNCKQYIPSSVIKSHGGEKAVARWNEFDMCSFVDDNPSMAWCTGPNCGRVVECKVDLEPHQQLDVRCTCGNVFCFNCKEEAHTPVDCEMVKKWQAKNTAESENLNYILVNTKPCPQCKRPIEKNQNVSAMKSGKRLASVEHSNTSGYHADQIYKGGCMHMMCSQCRHEFCWLCMGNWTLHNEGTGGFYACNRFEAARKRGDYDEETRRRENAKAMLERYTHYYERWALHNTAHKKAIDDQNKVAAASEESTMGKLSKMSMFPEGDLTFILGAWKQVVECRRILKYSYAYGYYKFEPVDDQESNQNTDIDRQKVFFEFLQGDAEASLEGLHGMVEKKLKELVEGTIILSQFQDFRKNLIGLTDVTRDYFEKLVKQLEKGFENIEMHYAGGALHGQLSDSLMASQISRGQASQNQVAGTNTAKGSSGNQNGSMNSRQLEDFAGFWQCQKCTYANEDFEAEECAMCRMPRLPR